MAIAIPTTELKLPSVGYVWRIRDKATLDKIKTMPYSMHVISDIFSMYAMKWMMSVTFNKIAVALDDTDADSDAAQAGDVSADWCLSLTSLPKCIDRLCIFYQLIFAEIDLILNAMHAFEQSQRRSFGNLIYLILMTSEKHRCNRS